MITPDQLICPATQLPCPNKAHMAKMLTGLTIGQMSLELAPELAAADRIRDKLIAEADGKHAAIEKDLGAACNGSVCGPLAQTASRFLYDGESVGEILGTQQ